MNKIMKNMLKVNLLAFFVISNFAHAKDYCKEREFLAVKIKMAKDYGVNSKKILIQSYEAGSHSDELGYKRTDRIVAVITRGDDDPIIESYAVTIKQTQQSDCKVVSVKLL